MSEDKKKKGKKPDGEAKTVLVSIAAHPRATAGIRRARTRAAFGAFMLVLALNLLGNEELFDALWRALLAGIVVNVIVWRCAIIVWRHVIVSEIRQEQQRRIDRVRAHRERTAKLAADHAEASGNPRRAA